MTKNKLWISGVAAPVLIATMLLALSSRVTANAEPSAPAAAVKIDNFVFGPQTITVPVGTTVTSYTFTKAGTYPYYCTIHPKMTGKVVVQ